MKSAPALQQAQSLAETLPRLILAAERLAFIAAAGQHGRRQGGHGDSFWQFRDWQSGDTKRIDWRRSARSQRLYIREREWEAQAGVALSLEDTPTLAFQSDKSLPTKRERAVLLLLAVAAILLRAGERVALAGVTPPLTGHQALPIIAASCFSAGRASSDPKARLIRFGDFLNQNLDFTGPIGGAVVHILDPEECDFPFHGRIVFEGYAGEPNVEAASAEDWAATYRARIAAQKDAVKQAASRAGQTPLFHRTDMPPTHALVALYQALLRL